MCSLRSPMFSFRFYPKAVRTWYVAAIELLLRGIFHIESNWPAFLSAVVVSVSLRRTNTEADTQQERKKPTKSQQWRSRANVRERSQRRHARHTETFLSFSLLLFRLFYVCTSRQCTLDERFWFQWSIHYSITQHEMRRKKYTCYVLYSDRMKMNNENWERPLKTILFYASSELLRILLWRRSRKEKFSRTNRINAMLGTSWTRIAVFAQIKFLFVEGEKMKIYEKKKNCTKCRL